MSLFRFTQLTFFTDSYAESYYIQENVMNISLGAKLFSIHSLTLQAVLNLYPILCAIRYLDTVTMDFGGVTMVL